LIHFEGRRYREFGYQEKGGERSSNFMKRKVPIHKKEIRTIGSQGLWTVDLTSGTRKFGFQKDEQVDFVKREIMKHSKGWPTVIVKGHIE
jgi:hypothetical protein